MRNCHICKHADIQIIVSISQHALSPVNMPFTPTNFFFLKISTNAPPTCNPPPPTHTHIFLPVATCNALERLPRGAVVDQSEALVVRGRHVQTVVLQVHGRVTHQLTFQVVQPGGEHQDVWGSEGHVTWLPWTDQGRRPHDHTNHRFGRPHERIENADAYWLTPCDLTKTAKAKGISITVSYP